MNAHVNAPAADAADTSARGRKGRPGAQAPKGQIPVEAQVKLLERALKAAEAQNAALAEKVSWWESQHSISGTDWKAEATRLYEAAIDTDAVHRPLMSALADIAAHFYEPGQVFSKEAGQWIGGNTLAMQQKFFLKDLCYMACNKLHYHQEQLERARDKYRQVLRTTVADEIGLEQRSQALAWGQRTKHEAATVEAILREAEVMFEAVTGERYQRPAPKAPTKRPAPKGQAQLTQADLDAQARALGFDTEGTASAPYTPTHNGVDAQN